MIKYSYKIFLLVSFVCCYLTVAGQQHLQNTMHLLTPYKYVNAYAGFDKSLSATLLYRNQWTPLNKNPKNIYLDIHMPVYLLNGAMGLKIASYQSGIQVNNDLELSYNMVKRFWKGYISGGGGLGISHKTLAGSEIITPEGVYASGELNHLDPILPLGTDSAITGLWSFSILYKDDNLNTGLQISNLFGLDYKFSDISYAITPVITGIATYNYQLTEEMRITPSILLTTNSKLWQLNLGCMLEYGNIFGGINVRGISGDSFESVGMLSGIRFGNHYTIAYSFDLGLSALRKSSEGSHEIILKYNLNRLINTGLPPKIIFNSRNL